MKTHGDMPLEDQNLVQELQKLENWFNTHKDTLPTLSIAKGLVCMGHDYLQIGMEEECERLLRLAESNCPGYFKGPIFVQTDMDLEYFQLFKNITNNDLGMDILISLVYEDE